jgi:hypothetical protein
MSTLVTGNGTGSSVLVTGNGTGAEAITITLPQGTGMSMEVSVGCGAATVSIIDSMSMPVVSFANVPVLGDPGFCSGSGQGAFGAGYPTIPEGFFESE